MAEGIAVQNWRETIASLRAELAAEKEAHEAAKLELAEAVNVISIDSAVILSLEGKLSGALWELYEAQKRIEELEAIIKPSEIWGLVTADCPTCKRWYFEGHAPDCPRRK